MGDSCYDRRDPKYCGALTMSEKPAAAKKKQPLILNVDPGTLLLIVALSLLLPLLFIGFTAH